MLTQALAWLTALVANERGTVPLVTPDADPPIGDDVELVDEILTGEDAPADGSLAPEPGSEAPAVPAVQPPAVGTAQPGAGVDRGDGRDATGKFVKPAAADAPAPSAPGAAGTAPVPAPPATPPSPELDRAQFAPFSYRGAGQDVELPHSYVAAQGVLIANDGIPALKQLLAEAHGYGRQGRRREAELLERLEAAQNSPDVLRAASFSKQIQALFAQGQDAVIAFFDDFDKNRAKFLAAAEAEVKDRQIAALQARVDAIDDEQEGTALGAMVGEQIDRQLAELARHFPGLDAAVLRERLIGQLWDTIVYAIDPKKRQLREGEIEVARGRKGQVYVLNRQAIEQEAAYFAQVRQQRVQPVTAAADANAKVLAAAAAGAGGPPAPPSGAPPMPPGDAELVMPTTKEELDAYWDKYMADLRTRTS